jgi:hypothetical protein
VNTEKEVNLVIAFLLAVTASSAISIQLVEEETILDISDVLKEIVVSK